MGNTVATSNIKKESDLSPQALSQTSDDDKVWLDVTEENLFNENFTNEKFYLLHSRHAEGSVEFTNSIQRKEHKLGKEEQATKRAEELLDILVEHSDGDTTEISKKLATDVQQTISGKRTLYYDSVLKKRISILKRIHLALSREKAREKVTIASSITEIMTLMSHSFLSRRPSG